MPDAFNVDAFAVDLVAFLKAASFFATMIIFGTFSWHAFVVDASCLFIALIVAFAVDGFALVVFADF